MKWNHSDRKVLPRYRLSELVWNVVVIAGIGVALGTGIGIDGAEGAGVKGVVVIAGIGVALGTGIGMGDIDGAELEVEMGAAVGARLTAGVGVMARTGGTLARAVVG